MRSGASPLPPDRVPTLTEVILWPQRPPVASPVAEVDVDGAKAAPRDPLEHEARDEHGIDLTASLPLPLLDLPLLDLPVPDLPRPLPFAAPPPPLAEPPVRISEEQVTEAVLTQLQRQVDLMLEYRIREVLTPLLERAADGVVRDARGELASTLRDLVARAVSEELAKHRAG